MTVRVGVIGAGMIGHDHIRRITQVLSGGSVVAITDIDPARAERAAYGLPGVTVHPAGRDLVRDSRVDAILVTSWGPTHEEHVLAAIDAGKPVFCEKPLATTSAACLRIVDAEVAAGRRLVQVGFMRRYDAGYTELKAALDEGRIGAPLLMHCAHRTASPPAYGFTTETMISDAAVHEIDIARWLFEEEVAAAVILTPRRSRRAAAGLHDPLIVLLEMASGLLVDVEVFVNAAYGYDIRAEIVGESGAATLAGTGEVRITSGGQHRGRIPAGWQERFSRAFDCELQDWLRAAAAGTSSGPSCWDGYAATVVAESCVQALRTGSRTAVPMRPCPGFYGKAHL
jgi:myo-inositol 2-dehydrogenase/D-chiro-inositol 1-dehydrogenase